MTIVDGVEGTEGVGDNRPGLNNYNQQVSLSLSLSLEHWAHFCYTVNSQQPSQTSSFERFLKILQSWSSPALMANQPKKIVLLLG